MEEYIVFGATIGSLIGVLCVVSSLPAVLGEIVMNRKHLWTGNTKPSKLQKILTIGLSVILLSHSVITIIENLNNLSAIMYSAFVLLLSSIAILSLSYALYHQEMRLEYSNSNGKNNHTQKNNNSSEPLLNAQKVKTNSIDTVSYNVAILLISLNAVLVNYYVL